MFKTLYHETMAPAMPASDAEEAKLRALGYQDTYVHQEYPKHLFHPGLGNEPGPTNLDGSPKRDGMGKIIVGAHKTILVKDAEHEKVVRKQLQDNFGTPEDEAREHPDDFGKAPQKRLPPSVLAKQAQEEAALLQAKNTDLQAQIEQLKAMLESKGSKGK